MNGFWAERVNYFKNILDSKVSVVAFLMIIAFVINGILNAFSSKNIIKNEKLKLAFFLVLGIAGTILSIGYASDSTYSITKILDKYLPFYKGMREPQKWVSVITISYVFFFCRSIEMIYNGIKTRRMKYAFVLFSAIIPIIYAHQMLWGFNNQLKVADYPKGWYEINAYLNNDKSDSKAVFFPWSFYPYFSFAGRNIIIPALSFFDKFTYIGDDTRVNNTYQQKYYRENELIENNFIKDIERGKADEEKMQSVFSELGIKYIILAKEKSTEKILRNLDNLHVLDILKDGAAIKLYKIKEYGF